ncbi:asparaginyl-tRNA synthetase [Coniosporium tulheliwenetii]|uniref:Asparaginyl-tRNA synthetase n=1 Tax=Coniosporium tulheliwenetii TaxID=3383036 RepID=A0ACC2ZI47_9PEZI|nr:asparaginyl-tRNA synthetase [Cladosporium sp. JES 115]
MLEVEMSFVDTLDPVMDLVEDMLREIGSRLRNSTIGQELLLSRSSASGGEEASPVTYDVLLQRWQGLAQGPWPRITYAEAIARLQQAVSQEKVTFEFEPSLESGLQAEHERFLAERIAKKFTVSSKPPSHSSLFPNRAPCATPSSSAFPDQPSSATGSSQTATSLSQAYMAAPVEETDYDYESLPPNFSLAANMLAGAFAGIAEHSVMYPVDLLKVIRSIMPSYVRHLTSAVPTDPDANYQSLSNRLILRFVERDGHHNTRGRVQDTVERAFKCGIGRWSGACCLLCHIRGGQTRSRGNRGGKEEHHPFAAALSGASATIASDALMNPFDVVKQRMQLQGSVYKTIGQCARDVFRREGFTAFYVSYPTTLCMTVPFTATQFVAYESLSKAINPTGKYDPYTHCTAGALAGGVAAGITTPLDVIKTLLQTRGTAADPELRNARGLWEAASIIRRRDGYRGFFRGLKPRIITTMPSTAICWSAYEMAKAFFIARNEA